MPEPWDIYQGKLHTQSGAVSSEMLCVLQAAELARLLRTFGQLQYKAQMLARELLPVVGIWTRCFQVLGSLFKTRNKSTQSTKSQENHPKKKQYL